jgi:hypothetical protein
MKERSLHAALKEWYAQPGDRLEEPVDGFVIDICRGDLLVEIQTANFSSIRRKLTTLAECHPVRLVHPIARDKWIVRLAADGLSVLGRRKSPKRGTPLQLFEELVSCPGLVSHPNFSLEVLLTREDEVRRQLRGRRRSRKPWRLHDRQLVDVADRRLFRTPADFHVFLPGRLPQPFTSRDLAQALGQPRYLAQQMTYCFRKMGAITAVGKRGNALLYSV